MTVTTSIASLGGVGISKASAVRWTEVRGTQPSQAVLVFHEDEWSKVEGLMGTETYLELGRFNGTTTRIERLTVLREVPANKPFLRAVLVADRRWKWPYVLVAKDYNIVRRIGETYIVGNAPVELQGAAQDYTYTRWSKKPSGAPWSALDVIEDVIKTIVEYEVVPDGGKGYVVDGIGIKDVENAVKVENLSLADPGDMAIRRVLTLLPMADVTVDAKGEIHIFNAMDQEVSREVLDDVRTSTEAGGQPRFISPIRQRPKKIIVYFEREIEVRGDNSEETDSQGTVAASNDDGDLILKNCAPIPDIEIEIGGRKLGAGSYADLDLLLPVYSEDIGQIGASIPLTFENLRKMWFIADGYWTPFGNLQPNADEQNWTARIGTLKAHYRRTFRAPAAWRDAVKCWKPWRVGVVDPINKMRTPAMAWSEYAIEPSAKFRVVGRGDPNKQFTWLNVEGYPGRDGELDAKSAAPCRVQVVDEQVGIFHLDYLIDPYGMRSQIVPSCLRKDGGSGDLASPTRDLSDIAGLMGTQWRLSDGQPIGLSANWGMALVVTAMPGAPNGKARLHRIDVEPDDLEMGFEKAFTAKGGTGPVLEVYVPPSIMTAWYAWTKTSEARETAKALFGLTDAPAFPNNVYPGYTVLNGQYLLPAIARAMAAVHYAQFVDAIEGEKAGTVTPKARVAGNVEAVTHSVGSDGRVGTLVSMPAARRAMDFLAAVPPELRTAILGTLPAGRG